MSSWRPTLRRPSDSSVDSSTPFTQIPSHSKSNLWLVYLGPLHICQLGSHFSVSCLYIGVNQVTCGLEFFRWPINRYTLGELFPWLGVLLCYKSLRGCHIGGNLGDIQEQWWGQFKYYLDQNLAYPVLSDGKVLFQNRSAGFHCVQTHSSQECFCCKWQKPSTNPKENVLAILIGNCYG